MSLLNDPEFVRLLKALTVVSRADAHAARDDYDILFRVPDDTDLRGYVVVRVSGEAFDALVERGWVRYVGADGHEVTESGKHWCLRWQDHQKKAARGTHSRRAVSWRRARRS